MDNDLRLYLATHKISYDLYKHAPVATVAESHADIEIQKIPGLRCKTLFLKDDQGRFYLVALPGLKRLDIPLLEERLNVRKLHFGSVEEMKEKIHVLPGNVSIFAAIHSQELILILDELIWKAKLVCFHPNINTETLTLDHSALETYYASLSNKKMLIPL